MMEFLKAVTGARSEGSPTPAMRPEAAAPGSREVRLGPSRRSTVMLALHRSGVIREYQSDSSSKRPASSLLSGSCPGEGVKQSWRTDAIGGLDRGRSISVLGVRYS
jgi:hypothetical protein